MKVLVTGATGLVGKKLVHKLLTSGHEVVALARSPEKLPEIATKNIIKWDDTQSPPSYIFSGCDAVIHLAGEGIADKRWTPQRKEQLWNSRVNGTKNLVDSFSSLPPELRPRVFISGSAIGYYPSSEADLNESAKAGTGFLSNLCKNWEKAATQAEKIGIRTVLLRTGLVLSREGGVLSKTGPVILGDGNQWMSWIHIDDMIRFILFSLENTSTSGPYNLTSPLPVQNKEFTKVVARVAGYPFTIKAPSFALKLALGELAETVLANQKVLPARTLAAGFAFEYPEIQDCIKNLLSNYSLVDNVFYSSQFVPLNRKEVFSFFSQADNLETLTPPWLNFNIYKKSTQDIEQGTLIDYKLKIHGIPLKWKTLILEWNPETSFVDLQLKGPYKKWHHLHTFEEVLGGTLISDHVTFQIPGGIAGKLLLPFIRKDVNAIFKFRQNKIRELFQKIHP